MSIDEDEYRSKVEELGGLRQRLQDRFDKIKSNIPWPYKEGPMRSNGRRV